MKTTTTPQFDLTGLELRLAAVSDPKNLNSAESENLWTIAAETAMSAGEHERGEAVNQIANWLFVKVSISKSRSAIRRQLYRKIKRIEGGRTLTDLRREAGKKKKAPPLPANDETTLITQAVKVCGGELDFAWQNCVREKLLSEEVLARYPLPKNRAARCPKPIRRQVAAKVAVAYKHHIRPHYNSNNVAPMSRDWSGVYAQDIYECDDKTLDVYCRAVKDENGILTEQKIRCQVLPMIDSKSGKILDFVLIGESNYNAVSIRTLIKKVCLKYGLPKKFQFERGLWKNARLLGNNKLGKPFAEVENFSKRLGVPMHHALPGRARSKIVETVFRLQDRFMKGWPGYIGLDEMHQKFERVVDAELWTFEELFAKLGEIVEKYNDTPSQSKVKGGYLTPNEVWAKCRNIQNGAVEPVCALPPEFEYRLSTHCQTSKVRIDGVKFTLGKAEFHYHSAQLVDLGTGFVGHTVKVWMDPEFPETAVVTDLKENEALPVLRIPKAPAYAQTSEEWRRVAAASQPYRVHMKQIRQLYSNLHPHYVAPARPIVADANAIVKAQRMTETFQTAARLSRQTATEKIQAERARQRVDRWKRNWRNYRDLMDFFLRMGGKPNGQAWSSMTESYMSEPTAPKSPDPEIHTDEELLKLAFAEIAAKNERDYPPERGGDLSAVEDSSRDNGTAVLAGFMEGKS